MTSQTVVASDRTSDVEIGARIADRREGKGMNQRDLSAATGISQTMLSHIERGQRTAGADQLVSLSWALGTTYGDLIGDTEVRDRLIYAARANSEAAVKAMVDEVAFYFELGAHLDDFGVQ